MTLSQEISLSIAVIHPGEVSFRWHESILHTMAEPSLNLHLISGESGVLVAEPRNHLIDRFLTETDDEYLLWTDSDIEWKPEHVLQLLSHDLPIVGGLYIGHSQTGDTFPVFNTFTDKKAHRATWDDVPEELGVIEVFGVGCGFTLVKREVFKSLGTRLYWPYEEQAYHGVPMGEDVTFCLRARSKGYKSYIDLDTRVGHRKAVTL